MLHALRLLKEDLAISVEGLEALEEYGGDEAIGCGPLTKHLSTVCPASEPLLLSSTQLMLMYSGLSLLECTGRYGYWASGGTMLQVSVFLSRFHGLKERLRHELAVARRA